MDLSNIWSDSPEEQSQEQQPLLTSSPFTPLPANTSHSYAQPPTPPWPLSPTGIQESKRNTSGTKRISTFGLRNTWANMAVSKKRAYGDYRAVGMKP